MISFLGIRLVVMNMSQQTDSTDLLGGYVLFSDNPVFHSHAACHIVSSRFIYHNFWFQLGTSLRSSFWLLFQEERIKNSWKKFR